MALFPVEFWDQNFFHFVLKLLIFDDDIIWILYEDFNLFFSLNLYSLYISNKSTENSQMFMWHKKIFSLVDLKDKHAWW